MEDIQVAQMSSSLQGETESTTEVSDNSDLPEIAIENIPNDESSWLADVDDDLVMESNSKTPKASDETSKNTGERILNELQNETLDKPILFTPPLIPAGIRRNPIHSLFTQKKNYTKVEDIHFVPTSRVERDNSQSVYIYTIKLLK